MNWFKDIFFGGIKHLVNTIIDYAVDYFFGKYVYKSASYT